MNHKRSSEHTSFISNEWWLVRFNKGPRKQDAVGLCYQEAKVIDILEDQRGDELLSTLLHEHLHAVFPYLTEEAIQAGEVAAMEAVRVARERAREMRGAAGKKK